MHITVSYDYTMKKKIAYTLFALAWIAFIFSNCNNTGTPDTVSYVDSVPIKGAQAYERGKVIYSKFCAACHGNWQSHIEGPNIFDMLFDRLPNPPNDYFRKFIKDTDALVASGDAYYQILQEKFQISIRHVYKDKINNSDLDDLLVYMQVSNRLRSKGWPTSK